MSRTRGRRRNRPSPGLMLEGSGELVAATRAKAYWLKETLPIAPSALR